MNGGMPQRGPRLHPRAFVVLTSARSTSARTMAERENTAPCSSRTSTANRSSAVTRRNGISTCTFTRRLNGFDISGSPPLGLDIVMSVEGDNLVSNRRRGKQRPAWTPGSGRCENRPDQAAAAAIAPRGGRTGRDSREHVEEDRERRGQSDALRARGNCRSARREGSRFDLQITG